MRSALLSRALSGLLPCRPALAAAGGSVATAAAVACAQAPLGQWWLGCVALTPWLAASRGSAALILGGGAWGTLSGLVMGSWIYGGLRNIGAAPLEAFLGLALTSLAVTGLPGALYGAAAAAARRAPTARSAVFAALVCAVDWARGLPHLGLPWCLLGHTQASAPGVAQLAVVGGVPLISGLLAGLSYSVGDALRGRSEERSAAWMPWLASYLALLVLGLPAAHAFRPVAASASTPRRLLAIQHRIPPGERWKWSAQEANLARLAGQTLEALDASRPPPDVVLWPETSLTVALEEAPPVTAALRRWLEQIGAPLIFGGVAPAGSWSRYRNSAIWVDASGQIRDRFDKTLAVPFVEREPTSGIEHALRRVFGALAVRRLVVESREQRPLRGDDSYAVTLCFEVIYSRLVSERLDADSLAILNLANDAWYGSDIPGRQQLAFASFRAIEHRRPLLRVADSGPSALIDPFGRVVRRLDPDATGALWAAIAPAPGTGAAERVAIAALTLSGALVGLAARASTRWWSR